MCVTDYKVGWAGPPGGGAVPGEPRLPGPLQPAQGAGRPLRRQDHRQLNLRAAQCSGHSAFRKGTRQVVA